jgi:large subunit ribosomal protein L4
MAKDKNIIVLEDFSFDTPKTKSYTDILSNFDLLDNKTVLVLAESNKNIFLSSRNLKKVKVVLASELNTYTVMNANKLMVMESSINEIEKNF